MPCKKRSRTDCWADAWHAGEMAKAVKMGTFMLDTKMRPNDGITRQEAFTVLARAFKLVGEGEPKVLDRFSDKGDIANWALASLAGMTAEGYIQGSDGKLQPQANITRAEFATIMNNLVKQYIDSAEEVNEVADGNVIIRVPGVTLKDVTVKGDLIIADGVGDGDVTLDNVTVQGRTVVRGGGVDSIIIKGNSDVGKVIVAKVDGEIRIYVEGGAEVEIIYVDDGSDDVIVEGTIGELEVAGESVTVYARDADIGGATVSGD
ncbi:MAG TPA: S-layer homology domain-containing protein, partial [Clostridiales bacterium]|nr:S-layer homology domain-containing protein [Clostridiales bacterium]